jgi:hypothetical protein
MDRLPRRPGLDGADLRRCLVIALLATGATMVGPTLALAQAVNIDLGTGAGLTDRIVQLVGLMTVLSLAPSIVMMTTSFVRIVVVLSLLRTALGLQQSPPNAVIVSLALFLTAIIMGPTFTQSYNAGIRPLLDHQMELPQAFGAASQPVKRFMLEQVDRDDLALFMRLSNTPHYGAGDAAAGGDAGLHDLGAEAGVRDRLSTVRAVPGHRPGGGQRADEHGHDDAAAGGCIPAVQADLLRARRRLAAGRRIAGRELPARGDLNVVPGKVSGCSDAD